MSQQVQIPRPVDILIGVKAIAKRTGLGQNTIRKFMAKDGCPIIADGAGVARCDAAEFWEWYKRHMRQERGE